MRARLWFAALFVVTGGALFAGAAERPTISPAKTDANGFLVHAVSSPHQGGATALRVLLPEPLERERRYPTIYVLPVEDFDGEKYGNGLLEVKRHDLANKHQAIFVSPTFSHVPWFADHPSDPAIRQESYFVRDVVPLVEQTYPVRADRDGRLLLGFSKSGWGAWTLLLRQPDVFGRAAAWDAPLMMEKPDFGSDKIFATQQNFERYQLSKLVRENGPSLGNQPRLILTGTGSFASGHEQMHALLDERRVPHGYRDGPKRSHDWHSGWVSEAVELLLAEPIKP
ncbi:MAG: alpha/beta hydrolase-fold protein [Pirellulales bacterium]